MINWKDLKINFGAVGHRVEINPDAIGKPALLKRILETGEGCISTYYKDGYSDDIFKKILAAVSEFKGRKILENISNSSEDYVFLWDDAIIETSFSKSSKLTTLNLVSINDKITATFKEITSGLKKSDKKGYVFSITRGGRGNLGLTRLGFAAKPLIRENYTPAVCKDYDFIVNDLKSNDPDGRIIIIDGSPGTGKTFFTRSLLGEASNCLFVIVPPGMVSGLGNPELLPLLIQTKESYAKTGSTVLICEDADNIITTRMSDNINSISAVLNLSDGIVGELLNFKIICTTNAKVKDLDAAIMRDMRLSRRVSINSFDYDQANKVFKRLVEDDKKDLPRPKSEQQNMLKPMNNKTSFTLAEVYKAARNEGYRNIKISEENASNNPPPDTEEKLLVGNDDDDEGDSYDNFD